MAVLLYEQLSKIARAGSGYKPTAETRYGLKYRISGFLVLIRPIFLILTPLNAASAAVLALGGYPSFTRAMLGFIAVAAASCAINVFNDYTDRERDKLIWPNRPIPSGRVKPYEALYVAVASLGISLSIAWFVFNATTFFILLLAIVMGALYSTYLRNKVGYLSLPPIVGLIYLGGWAAFSPETLFSSVLPWYLYLIGVVWQAGHILVYYPMHLTGSTGESSEKVPPVFFFAPSPKTAVRMGIIFICITLLCVALLPLLAPLGILYLVLVLPMGLYALVNGLVLLKDALNRSKGIKAFTTLTVFRLTISVSILLQVFISQL